MPPLTLEGDTLGQKHQHFNKLVDDALTNNKRELTKINFDENDIDNLLKIEVASRNKNVDYILEVLKCEDLLYVSRALKRCQWLVTEQQYAHVINPQYLHTQLFPHMTTKAINKLLLHIKLNLKEEKRVEEFYDYIKQHKSTDAAKWLQNCSLSFVENVCESGTKIPTSFYKRLCRRSFNFIKYYKNAGHFHSTVLAQVTFLIYNHTEEYLDFMDSLHKYDVPSIGKKPTEFIMKKCPHRIMNEFERYARNIDLAVIARHLKKEEIIEFLLKHIKNNNLKNLLTDYDNLKHFVKYIPKENRYDFLKKVLVAEKTDEPVGNAMFMSCCSYDYTSQDSYRWYQYAPFNLAFRDLKKLIRGESSPSERCNMLAVMLNASRSNPQHLLTVLQYYHDKHMNEPLKFKLQFINNVLAPNSVNKFDGKTWDILNQLFYSAEIYAESNKNVQTCIKSIILYNIINGNKIPEVIEKQFTFDTFKTFQSHLNQEQKEKLYNYLLNYLLLKLQNETIENESQLQIYVELLMKILKLLKDWQKDLKDLPILIQKIQQVISIKKSKSWDTNLSSLYNMNKKWRRHLFSESLSLWCSEQSCLNALKHSPQLLARHSTELVALRTQEHPVPRRLLAKLRIYWSHTIAQEWINTYYERLNEMTGHKATIIGLFTLLSQKLAIDIAKKYVPEETKINWVGTDPKELNIRKNIAQNLHSTRPLPPVDVVLWYAKGDYLHYAVPSLTAVLQNLSKADACKHIPKFLDAPVSLQKFGISLAFNKVPYEDLKPMFLNVWKTTKNSTIRALLFRNTFKMLCKVTEPTAAQDIWAVLSTFIDNLSNDENKIIYVKLGQPKNVHTSVRAEFYMKSYKFLRSLPAKNNQESNLSNLIKYAVLIMDLLDPDFVVDHLLASVTDQFCATNFKLNDLIATFILLGNTDEEQLKRFDKVLVPIMERAFQSWDTVIDDQYVTKNMFDALSNSFIWYYKALVIQNKIHGSVKLFAAIKNKFEEKFPNLEKYLWCTYWKLIETYVKLVDEYKWPEAIEDPKPDWDYRNQYMPDNYGKIWYEMHKKISTSLGPIYVEFLKEDVEKYYPSIYCIFLEALREVFGTMLSDDSLMILEILKNMLNSEKFIPSYLLVCEKISDYVPDEAEAIREEIRKIISAHPSEEVKMHFIKAFRNIPSVNKKEKEDGVKAFDETGGLPDQEEKD